MLIVGRGNEIGGATEYVITLINMLSTKFNVEIHMTYGKKEVRDYYASKTNNVTFHNIRMVREINPIADTRSIYYLVKLIKKEKFDIVHTNTSKGGIIGRIASAICKVPFVFHTVHGFSFHEQSAKYKTVIYSQIERLAAKFSDYIITVSDFHREWAIQLKIASEKKILSIPNGLNMERVKVIENRSTIRKNLNIAKDEIAIFTIGRLAEQKGIEYLLGAVPEIKDNLANNKYHFYIAGTGVLEEDLKNLTSKLSIENEVTFLGYRDDVNNLLLAADIIVIPSLWEGLSIALLEAMAAKNAIVCTEIGSNLTVVINNEDALIVEPKNSKQLSDAISQLILDNQFREKISNNAFLKYSEQFTQEIMLEKYLKFYEEKARLTRLN